MIAFTRSPYACHKVHHLSVSLRSLHPVKLVLCIHLRHVCGVATVSVTPALSHVCMWPSMAFGANVTRAAQHIVAFRLVTVHSFISNCKPLNDPPSECRHSLSPGPALHQPRRACSTDADLPGIFTAVDIQGAR